ncbi:MAG: sugar ABC transporter ATP-binding protein [Pedosphaera sp.]|nr:sugar ABC transporter ATP-binding protein [Pedosphaera sp.]
MTSPLLQLSGIKKAFGAVTALNSVSFDLRPGEVHALLGGNGAGKSTLIKVITGAHMPDAGTVAVGGHPISRLTPAIARSLGIACIYQQPALFPDLTVTENIGLRLESTSPFRRVRHSERRRVATSLLRQVGAGFTGETAVYDLSMPQQQLVEIACAIGAGAKILIMDEPTASLTQPEQELLFGVVDDLRRNGSGIIYISHRLEEIFQIANRVTVLRDGESVVTRELVRTSGPDGTSICQGFDEADLIRWMVGRSVERTPIAIPPASAPNRLTVHALGCDVSGVRNVTFDIRAGEIVGLTGLVGAGRTELARMLFGLTPADTGEIRLDGVPVTISSPAAAVALGIGYLPEDRRRHGIILDLPVAQNISMSVQSRIFPMGWLRPDAEKTLAEQYIRRLDIKTAGSGAEASTLSGGNQQKVAMARWLATNPKVLILDEPTQGVDVGAKSEIHQHIRSLVDEGLAVLLISSELAEILALSHRIGVMRLGTLTAMFDGQPSAAQLMRAALGNQEPGDQPC